MTAHDGFTLNDLVSYDHKHNETNGEDNRDGSDSNFSWNCGVEGPSDDPAVVALRKRQRRNLLATLLLAHGTPMLLAGDERARTQLGNNNAYCHDGPLTWIDWAPGEDPELLPFVRALDRPAALAPRVPSGRLYGRDAGTRSTATRWARRSGKTPGAAHSAGDLA